MCNPIGILFNILWCEFMCDTIHYVMGDGFVMCIVFALHFCPVGCTNGSARKAATRCICITQSASRMLAINSWTWTHWNQFRLVALLPLTVPYMTLQRLRPVVTRSWMKSPIISMDTPPKRIVGLYMDRSRVSRRTRNAVFNIDTSTNIV